MLARGLHAGPLGPGPHSDTLWYKVLASPRYKKGPSDSGFQVYHEFTDVKSQICILDSFVFHDFPNCSLLSKNSDSAAMTRIVSGADVYGPGSWVDSEALPVPEDAKRVMQMLADSTPGFTKDPVALNSVTFTGSPETIIPGPLKSAVIAGALHAMAGIVANEILEIRDGQDPTRSVSVDTDHAAIWLGSLGMTKRNGQTVREIAKEGNLASIFPKDLEKDTFATPLRLRATANYETKDPGIWYQLHGSLDADPTLRLIGLDPATQCGSNDKAVKIIAEHVRIYSASELEMMYVSQGLCGSICYTPAGWSETRMGQDLDRHPLINYSQQTHAVPTPALPLSISSDKRPLAGIKVVELVRVIAGPVIGSTLAAFGADVIRVNCGRLPDFNVSYSTHFIPSTRLFNLYGIPYSLLSGSPVPSAVRRTAC